MKNNLSNERKCVGCAELKNRDDLIKITKFYKTKEILVQPDSKHTGRSAYLCKDEECLKLAQKKKRINKALKINIPENVILEIESIIK